MNKQLIKGLISFIPGVYEILASGCTGSTARKCYSTYLRHLVQLYKYTGIIEVPKNIIELGPGDSIGLGLSAILSGANSYIGLDCRKRYRRLYEDKDNNKKIYKDLVELFLRKSPIPDNTDFLSLRPLLSDYSFPEEIINEKHLSKERLKIIEDYLDRTQICDISNHIHIDIIAPWHKNDIISNTIDLVISSSTLQYVKDLDYAFESMREWLKVGGYISHFTTFICYQTAKEWNGHWKHSDIVWKLFEGSRPFLINREPLSTYLNLLKKHNFEIVLMEKYPHPQGVPGIQRSQLAKRWRHLTDQDMATYTSYFIAKKLK